MPDKISLMGLVYSNRNEEEVIFTFMYIIYYDTLLQFIFSFYLFESREHQNNLNKLLTQVHRVNQG